MREQGAPAHASVAAAPSKHHRLNLGKMSPRAQAIAAEVRTCGGTPLAPGHLPGQVLSTAHKALRQLVLCLFVWDQVGKELEESPSIIT